MEFENIELLGIDNILFHVADLDAGVAFYRRCGFSLKFHLPEKRMALFAIGAEAPGLVLRSDEGGPGGWLWVEVRDAMHVQQLFAADGVESIMIETATGLTCEICDPFGNRLGFADYRKMPALARV